MANDEALVPATPGCPGCASRDRRIAQLEATVEELRGTVRRLEAIIENQEKRIRELEARLALSSRNSHRPPSSDPPGTKGKPGKPPTGRRPGGQEGHEGKKRPLLAVEDVDHLVHHYPKKCEKCGLSLQQEPTPGSPPPLRHQTWELKDKPAEVTEDQFHSITCTCGHATRAPLPEMVSVFGPGLTALVAFLSGGCHMSRRLVEEFL